MSNPEQLLQDVETAKNSLSTDRLDMSFGEIMSMYERDEIIINPDFQRFFRWTDSQKTRFIESMLLGIPIPPIFVAEDKNGRWELVDGLQRLSTFLSFFGVLRTMPEKNKWFLENGDLVPKLEGFSCESLPLKLQLNIKRATCRIEIIKWNGQYDMRFELFNRLNTGGSPLTNQEIRNCIYRGISSNFNNFLKKMAANEKFINLIAPSEQQIVELYLEELVLRFMSLYKNPKSVTKSIAQHMTYFMRDALHDKDFNYLKYEIVFNKVVELLSSFDNTIFRSQNKDFATALYDVVMIGVAENIHLYSTINPQQLKNKINLVKSDEVFKKITRTGGSNSVGRVRNRLNEAKRIFGN